MTYIRKTYDTYELHGNYGNGFEYILSKNTFDEIKERYKEYMINDPRPYKIKMKRIKKEQK